MLGIIKRYDLVNSYELNKKSLLKAFDGGLSNSEILGYLEQLTPTIPQTLRDLLGEWKEEYSAITIYDGIVVKADERLSRIIEAFPNLQDFLIAKIEKGIYLFKREENLSGARCSPQPVSACYPQVLGQKRRGATNCRALKLKTPIDSSRTP